MPARTPEPPYYAVIFSSTRTGDDSGYAEMAARMVELAALQPGFLGIESVPGITISYWENEAAIAAWHANAEHLEAQRLGYARWYSAFELRVARVERAYSFRSASPDPQAGTDPADH